MTITAFLGTEERTLVLTPELVPELERACSVGIGALATRVFNSDFRFTDLVEVIRFGLIGGGASPEDAARIVAAWVKVRPVAEILPVAFRTLELLMFGTATDDGGDE